MQINRYERSLNVPSVTTAMKLAETFGITTEQLITGSDANPEAPALRNIKLQQRLGLLDQLPRDEQDIVIHLIDAVLAKHRVETAMALPG